MTIVSDLNSINSNKVRALISAIGDMLKRAKKIVEPIVEAMVVLFRRIEPILLKFSKDIMLPAVGLGMGLTMLPLIDWGVYAESVHVAEHVHASNIPIVSDWSFDFQDGFVGLKELSKEYSGLYTLACGAFFIIWHSVAWVISNFP